MKEILKLDHIQKYHAGIRIGKNYTAQLYFHH